jgi:hypothetical protein
MAVRFLLSMLVAVGITALHSRTALADELFAATTVNSNLYSVNPSTAQTTLVGALDTGATPAFAFLTSLDFNPSGQLYGLNSTGQIGLINTGNAQTSIINSSPSGLVGLGFLSGLAINPLNGMAVVSDEDAHRLYSVNLSTGNYTLLGGVAINFADVRFDRNGNLYGVQYGSGNIYQINLNTLASTLIGSGGTLVPGMAIRTNAAALTFIETFDGAGSELRNYIPTSGSTVVGQLQPSVGRFDGIAFFGGQQARVPELDPAAAGAGLTLLFGGLVALRGRRRE